MDTSASTNRKTIRQFIRKRWKLVAINFKVLVIWSICEIVLCSLVICVKEKDYPENFLHNLCSENLCDNFLKVALYGRLTLSFLSLLGTLIGVSSLAAPWFLMNALGIFPLLPVIYSCFDEYKVLDKTYSDAVSSLSSAKDFWNFLSKNH